LGEQLQLSGFVRNLPEGSVEVCAQGARDHLEELIVRLKREFPTASFETVYRQVGQKYSGFTIF
jgi:acylphosphatase